MSSLAYARDSLEDGKICQVAGLGRENGGIQKVGTFLTIGEAYSSAQGKLLQHHIKKLLKASNILPFH